jgi:LCP family protein required for cell wall assembly
MDHQPMDLLHPREEPVISASLEALPAKKHKKSPSFLYLLFFGACLVGVGGFLFFASVAKSTNYEAGAPLSIFDTLARLVRSGEKAMSGETEDRVNILLLGIGGAGHDGPELSDTIIFGSFRPSTKELGLISIPRDLTVFVPGQGYRKINAVNALAEQSKPGSGRDASAKTVSDILGQPTPYSVKIDFRGFADVIDALGGVDIYVDRTFTDATFPVDDGLGSVKTISFVKGWAHLDGTTALEYARSRHGGSGEGTDFARAARQQKILIALKERALSMDVILNPTKLSRIMSIIQKNVQTNMSAFEMIKFAKYIPDISTERISLHVLDATGGLLYETYINSAYVLLPYEEDWSDLKSLASNIYAHDVPGTRTPLPSPSTVPTDTLTIEIQNGTLTTGLGGDTAQLLQSSGFTVSLVTNAEKRDTAKTTIYDFTDGAKGVELSALKSYLKASVVMTKLGSMKTHDVIPDSVMEKKVLEAMKKSASPIDFLVVLGQDSTSLSFR